MIDIVNSGEIQCVMISIECLEQPYAGFRLKLCQIKAPSKTDIRSSQCG